MRILPAALYFAGESTETFLKRIHEISAITHAHTRARIGCGIYALLIRALINSCDKLDAYHQATSQGLAFYGQSEEFRNELRHFMRILSHEISNLEENDIESSGYIVHTLEASIWCFLRNFDAKSILLEAVNLGIDTDTTGTVAGGLAGLYHGLDSIPIDWLESLARKDEIDELITAFTQVVAARLGGNKKV
jgi:ADP-ribosylglycohydrolase